MTLIVAFISDDFAVLASDRRITWQIGGAPGQWEDTENKVAVLDGHMLLGYTGFARLDGQRTEEWILEKLAEADPDQYLPLLEAETAKAIARLRLPLERSGHAYVATGYARDLQTGELRPCMREVSNALGGLSPWLPRPHFTTADVNLEGDKFKVRCYGTKPPRALQDETLDLISRYLKRHPKRILGVAQLMVGLIRRVADMDVHVGLDVSVSILPRGAVPADTVSMQAISEPVTELVCGFVPSGHDVDDMRIIGPAMIWPGLAMYGMEIRFGGEGFIGPRPPATPPRLTRNGNTTG